MGNYPKFLLVSIIALIFVISVAIPLRSSYALGPVVIQTKNSQLVAAQVAQVNQNITTQAGDTLIVGVTGALRSGSVNSITISAAGLTCQSAVLNTVATGAGAISISICFNTLAQTYQVLGVWTGNVCGGGSPCGFMGIWITELSGLASTFTYVNTSGTNGGLNAASASNTVNHTNTITYGLPALDLGYTAINTANDVFGHGTGFQQVATCSVSGVNSATPSCSQNKTDGSVGTTNFPFVNTCTCAGQWADEGIAITGGINTVTLTVTAWNTIDPATPTTWILAALYVILVPAMFWGFLKAFGGKPSTLVFTTLLGLTIAGFIGTISGIELGTNAVLPLGIALFFGISLAIFTVRSRSRGMTG